ncbi:hypothetical protein ACFQOY_03390 [Enterococcus alcedinis]|uniref:hypothetical protein n=1 Tax=Enterococcus alcedinis TaxID=1274384 RepID=UPI00166690CB|nr:hypothetical protein [Enterococcus alcedinis]MBP2102732.1 hypothetical protein [Enterococcus alcedinis]
MNKNGLVFAADSAVTVGNNLGSKVFNTANKLFSLGYNHDVGIMIYGNADFIGVPWEVIIKGFKNEMKDKEISRLEDYGTLFLKYLDGIDDVKNEISESMVIDRYIMEVFEFVFKEFEHELSNRMEELEISNVQDYERFINAIYNELFNGIYDTTKKFNSFTKLIKASEFKKKHGTYIHERYAALCKNNLAGIEIEATKNKFATLIRNFMYNTDFYSDGYTGVVIGGYGGNELFPKLLSYKVEGYIGEDLKYIKDNYVSVDIGKVMSSIIPFAQQEMVHTIMTGIDPEMKSQTNDLLNHSLELYSENLIKEGLMVSENEEQREAIISEITKAFGDTLNQISSDRYTDPIIKTVSSMPKEELPVIAETLINITSFKRKFSMSLETVGGPIDVLLITKSDGPIWIKRKHYFDSLLNREYINRKM